MSRSTARSAQPLGKLLLHAYRWFDDSLLASLHQGGWPALTLAQSMLFPYLDADGTRSAELARRMGVTRQAIRQLVKELEAARLVEQRPDPSNRSAKLVSLTAAGRRNVAAARRAFTAIETELAARIGPEAVARLRATLELDWGAPVAPPQP